MAGKQDKISHICQESCSLFSYSIAKVLLYVFVQAIKVSQSLARFPMGYLFQNVSVNDVPSWHTC